MRGCFVHHAYLPGTVGRHRPHEPCSGHHQRHQKHRAVGDITDIYVTNSERMLSDPYFSTEELSAIAAGYTILLEESANVLNDLRNIVNENGLSMSDKERMEVIDLCYNRVYSYRGLVQYYTNKNIGVSYLRAKKKSDQDRILALYGSPAERYW